MINWYFCLENDRVNMVQFLRLNIFLQMKVTRKEHVEC